MFKKKIQRIRELIQILKSPTDRFNFFVSKFTLKNFIIFGLITNVFSTIILLPIYNESYVNLSLSRFVSRTAGRIGEIKIPVFLREPIYNTYIKFYNVNHDEILDKNLKNYKTIKEFFIREIEVFFK